MIDPDIVKFYSSGGVLPFYTGYSQYGNGWIRTLKRIAFPLIKNVLGVAKHTARDVLENDKQFLPSLASNTIDRIIKRKRRRQDGEGLFLDNNTIFQNTKRRRKL